MPHIHDDGHNTVAGMRFVCSGDISSVQQKSFDFLRDETSQGDRVGLWLLESLVFAKRAARHIADGYTPLGSDENITVDPSKYENYKEEYKAAVLEAIEKERLSHE